jgi:hypothetical protein
MAEMRIKIIDCVLQEPFAEGAKCVPGTVLVTAMSQWDVTGNGDQAAGVPNGRY